MSNQRQDLVNELHPGQFLAQHPFKQADIPLYRQKILPVKLEVIPIATGDLHPDLGTVTRNLNAPAGITNEVCVSRPPSYLALTP